MNEPAEFDSRIRRFELAWQQGLEPKIADVLSDADYNGESASRHSDLLMELICIDLEFRWKHQCPGKPPILEDYVRRFPKLGSLDDLPIELIGDEYRVRHLWGDAPTHDEFLARFATRQDSICQTLQQIDREILDEAQDQHFAATILSRPQPATSQASTIADPQAPLPYSDYLLQRQIGAGAMGKVYRALQKSLDRPVAVKYLRKSFIRQPHAVKRFVTEARTVARFHHPGIVGIQGLGRTPNGGYFIVMDLIGGGDLEAQISAGPVAIAEAVGWISEACRAIQHAHDNGIIHCDLKPSNLLLDRAGNVRVTDFGLARSTTDELIQPADIAGTAGYMAPEQVSGYWGPISPRTDVYGLGGVLYALLTGRPPYDGNRIADILAKVVSAQPVRPPSRSRCDISDSLNDICQRCLSKSPDARFATAREVRDALDPLHAP